MSFRYYSGINKPGYNPLAAGTPIYAYNLLSWGDGSNGNLGLGNTTNYSSPKTIGSLSDWLSISCGRYHVLAIKTDGTLWAWGRNADGQLGLNNQTYYSSPKQVGALTTWSSIVCGRAHSIAIKSDGTLWTWGYNVYGQLGIGTSGGSNSKSSPIQVGSLTTWSKIGAGALHTAAIKTDGTLWTWGYGANGQLGLGNSGVYASVSSPNQVGLLTNWATMDGGEVHTLTTKTDGTLWAFGRNQAGQLGTNNTFYYSSPKQIGALTTWISVACGRYFSTGLQTNSTLWAWGVGTQGQLAQTNTTSYSSPKQVGSGYSSAVCGLTHVNALKTDGTLWSWGANGFGQLGLGDTTYRSSPAQVGASTLWQVLAKNKGYFAVAKG